MPGGQGGSPFDLIQSAAFDVVLNAMGYRCEWTPAAEGGILQTGKVLFKDPTKTEVLQVGQFEDELPTLEYKFGVFDALRDAANASKSLEVVYVYFTKDGPPTAYWVRRVKSKWDGKTLLAYLQLKP